RARYLFLPPISGGVGAFLRTKDSEPHSASVLRTAYPRGTGRKRERKGVAQSRDVSRIAIKAHQSDHFRIRTREVARKESRQHWRVCDQDHLACHWSTSMSFSDDRVGSRMEARPQYGTYQDG